MDRPDDLGLRHVAAQPPQMTLEVTQHVELLAKVHCN